MGFCVSKERRLIPPMADPITENQAVVSSVLFSNVQQIYFFKKVLGHGQFGTVREAVMIRSQQSVAIKSISKEKIKKDLYLLRRELEVMRQIDHPNVIRYYATYEDAKYLHIVMELCTGGDLLDKLLSVGSLTEMQVANIMRSLLLAVNYLHGMGICHRDLKPENFLFESGNPDAPIKLIDFGMAIKLGNIANMNSLVGTPYYLAPEVLRGNYGMHCDIWSLGVVMYLLLSGSYPFEGEDMKDLFRQIKKAEFSFEDTDWDAISMDAKDLIQRMLIKSPTERITAEGALKHSWFTNQGERSPHSVPPSVLTAIKKHKTPKKLQKEVMKVMIKFMSIQDIEELRHAFLELDQGNTGFISISDLASAMENAGFDMQVEEVKKIAATMDSRTQEGRIRYSDFLIATLDKKKLLDDELLFLTFQHFDADSDGFINVADLKIALENIGDTSNQEEMEAMISDWDLDKNRQIDFEEFKRMMLEAKDGGSDQASLLSRSSSKRARTLHRTLARITTPYD